MSSTLLYKPLYDVAVAQPQRPIYLENGQWGPALHGWILVRHRGRQAAI